MAAAAVAVIGGAVGYALRGGSKAEAPTGEYKAGFKPIPVKAAKYELPTKDKEGKQETIDGFVTVGSDSKKLAVNQAYKFVPVAGTFYAQGSDKPEFRYTVDGKETKDFKPVKVTSVDELTIPSKKKNKTLLRSC